MAKELADDELNLRRKARRRLIGAIALTLVVVVVLPMVLESEPKPADQDIDLRIPDPDNAGEFLPGVAIPEESTLPPLAEPVAQSATVAQDIPVVAVTDPEKSAVSSGKETDTENSSSREVTGKTPSVSKTSKPKISEAPKAADKVTSATTEGYVAQIGAYSNADTAKQELNKLKKWGFKAYTEKSGDKIRVRVGPYPEREKAEKVGKMLEKHGLHPVILSVK